MNVNKLSKGLGWLSLALGAAQLFAGKRLGKAVGVGGNNQKLIGGLGLREIVSGIGMLTGRRNSSPFFGRVGGMMDLALLGSALSGGKSRRGRIGLTIASIAATALFNYLAARKQNKYRPANRK